MPLLEIVNQVAPLLLTYTDSQADIPRAPGKWSAKEIIGHLIDSAANNHQRLVRGQFSDELGIEDYEQDDWVRVQGYSASSWPELVVLWHAYNRHLAHVIARMPADVRHRVWPTSHWWRVVPPEAERSLDFLVTRYEVHLRHHLGQVYEALGIEGGVPE